MPGCLSQIADVAAASLLTPVRSTCTMQPTTALSRQPRAQPTAWRQWSRCAGGWAQVAAQAAPSHVGASVLPPNFLEAAALQAARGRGANSRVFAACHAVDSIKQANFTCLALNADCHLHLHLQVIHEKLGIQHGCITTIHDVTNTQVQRLGCVQAAVWLDARAVQ